MRADTEMPQSKGLTAAAALVAPVRSREGLTSAGREKSIADRPEVPPLLPNHALAAFGT